MVSFTNALGTGLKSVPGAVITVCPAGSALGTNGVCNNPSISLFSNPTLATAISNPTNADANGNYFFCATPNPYMVCISGAGINARCNDNTNIANDPQNPIFASVTASSGTFKANSGTAAAPSYSFASDTGTGLYRQAAGAVGYTSAGTNSFLLSLNLTRLGSGGVYGISSNADPTLAASDTSLSRTAPATVAIGNGTQGDKSGTLQLNAIQGPGFQKQIFTSSGTFTIPTGITQTKATVVCAGGAGGGGGAGSTSAAGGGSGGAAVKWLTGLTPGNTITVTVGTGGTGVSGGNGNSGGVSSITSGTQSISTVNCTGGGGGQGNSNGSSGGGGGTATGGDFNFSGSAANPVNAAGNGSSGAPSIFGGGGVFNFGASPGGAGGAPGAGGGAAFNVNPGTGGAGANGVVIFEWVN